MKVVFEITGQDAIEVTKDDAIRLSRRRSQKEKLNMIVECIDFPQWVFDGADLCSDILFEINDQYLAIGAAKTCKILEGEQFLSLFDCDSRFLSVCHRFEREKNGAIIQRCWLEPYN